jgi:hypothetical protein
MEREDMSSSISEENDASFAFLIGIFHGWNYVFLITLHQTEYPKPTFRLFNKSNDCGKWSVYFGDMSFIFTGFIPVASTFSGRDQLAVLTF